MIDLRYLKKSSPFLWQIMREAAVIRHAVLVYGTWGLTELGHQRMYEHLKIVDKVYGK